jgi:SAM-dependent methyltransferase
MTSISTGYISRTNIIGSVNRSVQCPVCQSVQETFLPAGVACQRPNARCGICGSLERHRLVWLYLLDKKKLVLPKIRVLHFAPEWTFHRLLSIASNVDYWPVDIDPASFKYGGTPVTKTDIVDIPFKENWFDGVLCNHVLEHIPNDLLAMKELLRVIKPGGWAVLQVPINQDAQQTDEDSSVVTPEERELRFGQRDHVRFYGRDYPDRLTRAGFKVTVEKYVENFDEKTRIYFGLNEKETLFFCEKP